MEKTYKHGLTTVKLVSKKEMEQAKDGQPNWLKRSEGTKAGYVATYIIVLGAIMAFMYIFTHPYFKNAWHDPVAGFGMAGIAAYGFWQVLNLFKRVF